MGALTNFDHERFCQAALRRIWSGEKQVAAFHAAYREAIYEGENQGDQAIAANVRRLRNRHEIKARLAELAEYAAKLAGIDAGWAQLKLRDMVEANLDDYLSPPDAEGYRYFDLRKVPREKLAQLVELQQEETTENDGDRAVRKVRIKFADKIAALGLMARIAGWLAPDKQEHSGGLTLEALVAASMKPKEPKVVQQVVIGVPRSPDGPTEQP
jgi:hypothetical protein